MNKILLLFLSFLFWGCSDQQSLLLESQEEKNVEDVFLEIEEIDDYVESINNDLKNYDYVEEITLSPGVCTSPDEEENQSHLLFSPNGLLKNDWLVEHSIVAAIRGYEKSGTLRRLSLNYSGGGGFVGGCGNEYLEVYYKYAEPVYLLHISTWALLDAPSESLCDDLTEERGISSYYFIDDMVYGDDGAPIQSFGQLSALSKSVGYLEKTAAKIKRGESIVVCEEMETEEKKKEDPFHFLDS